MPQWQTGKKPFLHLTCAFHLLPLNTPIISRYAVNLQEGSVLRFLMLIGGLVLMH